MSDPAPTSEDSAARPAPRRRWRRRFAVSVVPLVLGLYSWQVEPYWGEVTEHSVGAGPASIRVLQITDVHIHALGALEQWVFDTVAARQPDLIVITGDTVNSPLPEAEREAAVEFLRRLDAPLGVYAVTGNHDVWAGERGTSCFPEAGVPLLDGKQVTLLDGRLTLQGLADARSTPLPATAGFDVALCHYPASFTRASEAKLELLLAGHSHGGQIQVPLWGALKLPYDCDGYAEGWFAQGDTRMFVCRGVGTSVAPLRFACRPELAEITIHLPE
ncbi:MAG: metallophosphoesterase family protein [Planctomycetes bacterium]|nr:metallophosphoesterase family protein [Planctomycetota bacterium]